MRKLDTTALIVVAAVSSMGCSSSATSSVPSMPVTSLLPTSLYVAMGDEELDSIAPVGEDPALELAGLPPSPWSVEALPSSSAPPALLAAWAQAENRSNCAPILPAAMGAAEGASARVSEMIEGGWAVEFDRRGMPGLAVGGNECDRCGRGVFGIAGTAMMPEELPETPAPSFADGSHLEVEAPADGESVAAAMLTVRGQSCVYQVWSFLGEDHLRELVDGLRRVEVDTGASVAAR